MKVDVGSERLCFRLCQRHITVFSVTRGTLPSFLALRLVHFGHFGGQSYVSTISNFRQGRVSGPTWTMIPFLLTIQTLLRKHKYLRYLTTNSIKMSIAL